MLFFYVDYGSQAWFFQDDFGFLASYAKNPDWTQAFKFTSFGRFLSRNLYWYIGQLIFGHHAILFFYFNLACISFSSFLIYKILRRLVRPDLAAVGAFAYFASAPVIHTYAWLSNSQHSLAHLLALGFAALYLRLTHGAQARRLGLGSVALLLALYLLGLSANIFAGLVLGLPLLMGAIRPALRREPRHHLLLAAALGLFFLFWLKLRAGATGAYELKVGQGSLKANADFYFGGIWVLAVLLLCCLYGAYVHFRRGALLGSWFFLSAIAFYLPFAFLVHQRYVQYIALSAGFFACGILVHIEYYLGTYAKRTALLLVLAVLATGTSARDYFGRVRWGRDQRLLSEQLRAFDRARARLAADGAKRPTYCFTTRAHQNLSGVESFDIPPEWWFVGFGKAFEVFVNPAANYQIGSRPAACDASFFIEGSTLTPLP